MSRQHWSSWKDRTWNGSLAGRYRCRRRSNMCSQVKLEGGGSLPWVWESNRDSCNLFIYLNVILIKLCFLLQSLNLVIFIYKPLHSFPSLDLSTHMLSILATCLHSELHQNLPLKREHTCGLSDLYLSEVLWSLNRPATYNASLGSTHYIFSSIFTKESCIYR